MRDLSSGLFPYGYRAVFLRMYLGERKDQKMHLVTASVLYQCAEYLPCGTAQHQVVKGGMRWCLIASSTHTQVSFKPIFTWNQ